MQLLQPCDEIWGADTLIKSDPSEEIVFRAIYNPFRPELWLSDPEWGIYDSDGMLLDCAAYYRLPQKYRVGQSPQISLQGRAIDNAPEADFLYVGPVIMHYGHFMTAFLPRLWQTVRRGISANVRFVCHSDHEPDAWYARDYVRCILGALGIGPERFVRPSAATRFRRLRIPRPAFEEQNFTHTVMRELGLLIGRALKFDRSVRTGPLYVSKTLVRNSTYRIGNEAAIDDLMRERGLTVIRPEQMSFLQQMEVLSGSSDVVGTIGSAFHTALFCEQPFRVIGLAYERRINANYALIDRLTHAKTTYVYPQSGLVPKPLVGVTFGYWLEEPEAVVNELLSAV